MKIRSLVLLTALSLFLWFTPMILGQSVGDKAHLESTNPKGVPVHASVTDNSFVRWVNGTIVKVLAIDGTWFHVSAEGKEGWAAKNYVFKFDGADPDTEPPSAETQFYVVGTWNLEWFNDGKGRGFPEYNQHGPKYAPRTVDDFKTIAGIITNQLMAKILVLDEINGRHDQTSSVEMDRLVGCLGTNWAYQLTKSGEAQRIAILYDSTAARKDLCVELNLPNEKVEGKGIFEREPLLAKFTFFDGKGHAKNDLVVVGVHLASGQDLEKNHSRAMELLRAELRNQFASSALLHGEKDVLVMGDFNADRYDKHLEDFWVNYDADGLQFKTMAPEHGEDYPPTRMAGVPIFPRSRIDYVLASGKDGGILDELVQWTAQVHTELLPTDFNEFRNHVSDHIPVTVRVKVVADDD